MRPLKFDIKKLYSGPWMSGPRAIGSAHCIVHTHPRKHMYVYHVDCGLLTVKNSDPSYVYDPDVAAEVYAEAYEHAKSCVLPKHRCVTSNHFADFEPCGSFDEDSYEMCSEMALYRFFDDKVKVWVSTGCDWGAANREVGQVQQILKDVYEPHEFVVKSNDGVEDDIKDEKTANDSDVG